MTSTAINNSKKCPARWPGKKVMTMTAMQQSGGGVNNASLVPTAMPEGGMLAEWPVNRRECVRVSLEQFKGVELINIRKWYMADDESIRPTKDGIALNVKHLPQLAEAIGKALKVAHERGLLVAHLG